MYTCPKCGSHHVHAIHDTHTRGYGILEGLCGWWLLGPIGLLCGLCRAGDSHTHTEFICGNCGNRF